ncbi:CRTAC1 family protein [Neiella sp. HB171785]|uniref:CRTAC1 family protein n=2 Tax=Neiella litorisoli TaxID=2771431 RepID=A0A8J6QGT5_9GAMM|nr:CRTAC1 family protein [Neiella litorisoli]
MSGCTSPHQNEPSSPSGQIAEQSAAGKSLAPCATATHSKSCVIAGLPAKVSNTQSFEAPYLVSGAAVKRVNLVVDAQAGYGNLSLYAGEQLLIDNLDIPTQGKQTLNALVAFAQSGLQTLRVEGRSGTFVVEAIEFDDRPDLEVATFADISEQIGLITEKTYKYGGPSIGDIDRDGHYDFVLNNHNFISTQLVMNQGNGQVDIKALFPFAQDFHGSALADYDADGDLDLMVAFGGANGTSPTSYTLLRNDDGIFNDVSAQAGINAPARGRSPRWLDMDSDGDLDLALLNAKTPNSDGPQQLFYQNNGDGTFSQKRIAGIENAFGERALITDFDGDGRADLMLFSPIALWRNNGDFTFTDMSAKWLPESASGEWVDLAAAEMDVNNDGRYDIYIARGKTLYELSKKSIDFNPLSQKLDIRDDGEKGRTAIDFYAPNAIVLNEMNLTYRQYNGDFPVFLGGNKNRHVVKATGFQPVQVPEEMKTADDHLVIDMAMAQGWPEQRQQNGLYIGHLGNGQWREEWVRNEIVYWNISFALSGLTDVSYDWQANNRNIQDLLLINRGDHFEDQSQAWNLPQGGNHRGVTHGDFNNDGWTDLFVYRYGFLKERVTDLLLLNTGKGSFETTTVHGAHDINDLGHGDMGQAFDWDLDGHVDLLNGSEEEGYWYLYQNQGKSSGNYLLVNVGYSPQQPIDSLGAEVTVTTSDGRQWHKRVGSAGEVFSQGQIDMVHFGVADVQQVASIAVRWRNGETAELGNQLVNRMYRLGQQQPD